MPKRLVQSIKKHLRPAKRLAKAVAARLGLVVRRSSIAARTPILRSRLALFLAARRSVDFPRADAPDLSVILAIHDGAEFALACLGSLIASRIENYEVVIVDNASGGRTRALLGQIAGATIIRGEDRLTRPQADRMAVARSRGEFLAFVDPDCRLEPDGLATALETIRSRPDIGAVGGKTLHADGSLEEAGSILWQDGSYSAYGQGRGPHEPEFMFARDVDFFSGGFLLTARKAYEDFATQGSPVPGVIPGRVPDRIDLGMSLWEAGWRSVFDPRIAVWRLDRSGADHSDSNRLPAEDRAPVAERQGARLNAQLPRSESNILAARNRSTGRYRVLHIEDRIPHVSLGTGYPRSQRIVAEMVKFGYFVTFYPTYNWPEDWSKVYRCLGRQVEVMLGHSSKEIGSFLEDRKGYYDVILISRPHNMEVVKPFLPASTAGGRPRVVYDAEALYSTRAIKQHQISGDELSPARQREMIEAELKLVEGCSAVLSVSDAEGRYFSDHGCKEVFTLGHCLDVSETLNPFERRSGLLFVGGIARIDTPNGDSVSWFLGQIFPRIRELLGINPGFQVAGTNDVPEIAQQGGEGVRFLGKVDDLAPVYDAARIFVAPTRFAAGIPLKCLEAAAHGLPIVATALLAEQLGWEDGVELLVADDAESFASQCVRLYQDPELWRRLRFHALERIRTSYSVGEFSATLRQVVGDPSHSMN